MTAAPDVVSKAAAPARRGILRTLSEPRLMAMLLLGFSSGLPFFLTANVLGFWLRDEGTSLTAIGFLSWVGFAYSFKFLWSPLIDRLDAPLVGQWLGRRRGWMLIAQLLVAAGLAAMAIITPKPGLLPIGMGALVVAFASATQDIVIDAWRIESAATSEDLGLLTSNYQLGYRVAVLVSDAWILLVANHFGWPISYGLMAALMGIGVAGVLLAKTPEAAEAVLKAKASLWTASGFADAVLGPFVAFFRHYGALAILILAFVTLYRVPEYVIGPMINPFYHDLGLSKDLIGTVRGTVGLIGTFGGIAVGGLLMAKLGPYKALIAGAVLQGLAEASFGLMATYGGDPKLFGMVMIFDNFGVSAAGVILIAYMSSLTSLGYTASQYALLSSVYSLAGKFLKGFSGLVVDGLHAHGFSPMQAYGLFFIGAGLAALPAILLCLLLAALAARHRPAKAAA
ncbi:MAG TPA: MFS transporter [Caulobacteraceae bacterium]|jgi:PAT family beta-lactamase induction signal transducer AmpG